MFVNWRLQRIRNISAKSFVIERSRRELIRILPKADICESLCIFPPNFVLRKNIDVKHCGLRTTCI